VLIDVGEQLTATDVTVGLDGRLLLPEPPPQPAASVSTLAAATWTMSSFTFRKADFNDFISCIPPPCDVFLPPNGRVDRKQSALRASKNQGC
jgi:hypothetical protein